MLHLSDASVPAYQSPPVGGAYKLVDQSDKFLKIHSAAAAAGEVADVEAKFHRSKS